MHVQRQRRSIKAGEDVKSTWKKMKQNGITLGLCREREKEEAEASDDEDNDRMQFNFDIIDMKTIENDRKTQAVAIAKKTMIPIEWEKYRAWNEGKLVIPPGFDREQMLDVFEQLDLDQNQFSNCLKKTKIASKKNSPTRSGKARCKEEEIARWFYSNMSSAIPLFNAIIKIDGAERKMLERELELLESFIEDSAAVVTSASISIASNAAILKECKDML